MFRYLFLIFSFLLAFNQGGFAGAWESNPSYKAIKKILVNESRGVVPPDTLIRSVEDHSLYYEKTLSTTLEKLNLKEASKIEDKYLYAWALLEIINIRQQREKNTSTLKKQLDFLEEYLSVLEKESKGAKDKLRSEFFRLIADVNNNLAPYHGFAQMMDFFKKSELYLQKSLELNKKNPRATKSLALSYYFKPRIAGGSVKQSIRLLNEALDYSKKDALVRYEVYIWLANAYSREKKKDKASEAIQKALTIYPAGGFANHVLGLIGEGKYIK